MPPVGEMQEKRHLIYEFSDYNMAGSGWTWRYYLEQEEDGSFTLFAEQTIDDDDPVYEDEEPWVIDPIRNLVSGKELYYAVQGFLSEVGAEYLDPCDFKEGVASVDGRLGEQFRQIAEETEEEREEREWGEEETAEAKAGEEREQRLGPFRKTIDEYIVRFSETPIRYPGGGTYGTRRGWAKKFIEEYVIEHGCLPNGEHKIRVTGSSSYSGSSHDFTELGQN